MIAKYTILLRRRTILLTGLIDHHLAVKAARELGDPHGYGSLPPWRAARAAWIALRARKLSPILIADLKRYRGKRTTKNSKRQGSSSSDG
jgi:hypothetical protein